MMGREMEWRRGEFTSIIRRRQTHEKWRYQEHNHTDPTRIIPVIASIHWNEEIPHSLHNIIPDHKKHGNTHTKHPFKNHLPRLRPPIQSRNFGRIQRAGQTPRNGKDAGRNGANGCSDDDSDLDIAVVFP